MKDYPPKIGGAPVLYLLAQLPQEATADERCHFCGTFIYHLPRHLLANCYRFCDADCVCQSLVCGTLPPVAGKD